MSAATRAETERCLAELWTLQNTPRNATAQPILAGRHVVIGHHSCENVTGASPQRHEVAVTLSGSYPSLAMATQALDWPLGWSMTEEAKGGHARAGDLIATRASVTGVSRRHLCRRGDHCLMSRPPPHTGCSAKAEVDFRGADRGGRVLGWAFSQILPKSLGQSRPKGTSAA